VSQVGGRAGESFISPTVQRERIAAYAASQGHAIGAWYEDLDQSGAKLARPQFQAALEACERGEFAGLIVAKLDRFARSVTDAGNAIRRLEAAGAELISVGDALDTSTPVGRFARTMMLAVAELELERISEGWRIARAHAIERGVYTASAAPVGYTRGKSKRLELEPKAAGAILAAFEARARGESVGAVARQLDASGIVARSWTSQATAAMIRNRAYIGESRNGDYVNVAAHAPIVSRAIFEAANSVRSKITPRSDYTFLLAGLIRCAGCSFAMAGTKQRRDNGRDSRRYQCKRVHAAGHCQACAVIQSEPVEELVSAAFLERYSSAAAETVQPAPVDVSVLEAELADAEAELVAFRDDLDYARLLGRSSHLDGIRARIAAVETAREALVRAPVASQAPYEKVDLAGYWPTATTAERRELLAAGIQAVMIRTGRRPVEERVRIVWLGESVDLPRRGRANAVRPFVF
jgi:DNA invertase Pin-like site-specific DNA recombinase